MSKDTNLQIRQYFDQISQAAQEEAKRKVAVYIESLQLDQLELNQQIVKLYDELQLVKKAMAIYEGKEYCMIITEALVYKIFSSRLLLYGVNEKEKLQQAYLYKEMATQMDLLYTQRIAQQPPFTYSAFLDNAYNFEFYALGQQPSGTSDKDYYRMRHWQATRLYECYTLEFKKLKERFLHQIETDPTSCTKSEAMQSELSLIVNLLMFPNQLSTKEFMANFSRQRSLPGYSMPEDEHEFHEAFCQLVEANYFNLGLFSPQLILSGYERIQADKISPAPIHYNSLVKFLLWLHSQYKKKSDLTNLSEPDISEVFEATYELAKLTGKEMVSEFRNNYPSDSLPVDQYKAIILAQMHELRVPFNSLNDPLYFQKSLIKTQLKNDFLIKSLYAKSFEDEIANLQQALLLNDRVVYLTSELNRIDNQYFEIAIKEIQLSFQFTDLISSMAPTSEFLDQLLKIYSKLISKYKTNRTIYFIKEDLKDSLREIYLKTRTNLRQLLDKHENNKKIPFVSYHLRELEYMELNASENGLTLLDHFKRLKRVFEIEMDYMKYQSNDQSLDIAQLLQDPVGQMVDDAAETKENKRTREKKTSLPKIMAFYYNEKKDDKLAWVHKTLLRLKAIPPETTLPELRELVDGQEVVKPLKWLAGQGDLMVFIKEATSNGKLTFPRQQQWKIAVRCFVKADGSKFNANSLKNALPTDRADEFIKAANKF